MLLIWRAATALVVALLASVAFVPAGAPPARAVNAIDARYDVQYGTAAGEPLLLDAFIPTTPGPHPAILMFHGGGWIQGDKVEFRTDGAELAANGIATFSVNYRLAPRFHAPAAREDARAALLWVRSNAAALKVDPNRVGALGDSAGGQLALMLGMTGAQGVDRADAVASWSAPTALPLHTSVASSPAPTAYIGCALTACRSLWVAESPFTFAGPGDAPTYMATSLDEWVPVEGARMTAQRLTAAGVPTVLHTLAGSLHGNEYKSQVWQETIQFLISRM